MRFSFALASTSLIMSLIFAQFVRAQQIHAESEPTKLKPFATDGCSMWIDGTPKHPYLWRHCCVAHDKAYWIGGAEHTRAEADKALQACVTESVGAAMGDYMHMGVIMGGSPIWITPYRWGYGWSYLDQGKPRGYKLLTEAEQVQVAELLLQAEETIAQDAIKHPANSTVLTGK